MSNTLDEFQSGVFGWMHECFTVEIAKDTQERNFRFLEEALELVQACDCTAEDAHKLVDYVFGREVGVKNQELGGVMVTLAALANAQGLNMSKEANTELERISQPEVMNKIREKQKTKPQRSPLPGKTVSNAGEIQYAFHAYRNAVGLGDTTTQYKELTKLHSFGKDVDVECYPGGGIKRIELKEWDGKVIPPPHEPPKENPDDVFNNLCIDNFAKAMKAKMKEARLNGRGGWNKPEEFPDFDLHQHLAVALVKGDPVDVGAFAMMIFHRSLKTFM